MTLSEQRRQFSSDVGKLLEFIHARGDECEIEEVKRSSAEANANAGTGAGIANSLHLLGLAVDISMFVNGEFTSEIEAYRPAADYWKSLRDTNRWGGDFITRRDVDHFSSERDGIR